MNKMSFLRASVKKQTAITAEKSNEKQNSQGENEKQNSQEENEKQNSQEGNEKGMNHNENLFCFI